MSWKLALAFGEDMILVESGCWVVLVVFYIYFKSKSIGFVTNSKKIMNNFGTEVNLSAGNLYWS